MQRSHKVGQNAVAESSSESDGNRATIAFGDPAGGDIFYTTRQPRQETFSKSLQVNTQPSSAIALGTIRGAQLAIGKSNRVHVVWNGSGQDDPSRGAPLFYTRMNDAGAGFERERSLMQFTGGLDGGGSVADDADWNVCVAWHRNDLPDTDETQRRLWVALGESAAQIVVLDTSRRDHRGDRSLQPEVSRPRPVV